MKTSKQRLLFEIINFALALLYAAPISILLERLMFPSTQLYMLSAVAALSALGYIAGRVVLKMDGQIAMIVCFVTAAIVAGVVLLVVPRITFFAVVYAVYAAFMTFFFFIIARKAGYAIYSPFAVSGILIYLIVMILMYLGKLNSQASELISYLAMVFFLLALYALNAKGLRRSLHKGADAKSVTYPHGMQMRNFLLVTGFIIVAAIISNIYPLFSLFGIIISYAVKAFGSVFSWINSALDQRTFNPKTTEDESFVEVGESIFDDIAHVETPFERIIFIVVVFACLLIVLIFFFRWMNRKLGKSFKGLSALMNRIRNMFDTEAEEDYVDEVESLYGRKGLLGTLRDNILEAARKFTLRTERIDDMPDNRMKVRFAYKELLKKGQERSPAAVCETPIEFYENDLGSASHLEDFIYYYNDARYSTGDVPDSAVQSAREALKVKLGVKKKP